MGTKLTLAERTQAYRNRNASYALPETRDVDNAVVQAVRDTLRRRGIRRAVDLEALPKGDALRSLVARTIAVLRERRFAVGSDREATRRMWRRLGLDS